MTEKTLRKGREGKLMKYAKISEIDIKTIIDQLDLVADNRTEVLSKYFQFLELAEDTPTEGPTSEMATAYTKYIKAEPTPEQRLLEQFALALTEHYGNNITSENLWNCAERLVRGRKILDIK